MLNNKVLSLKEKINCVSTIQVSSVRVSHKYPRFNYQFCTQVRAVIDYILPVMFPQIMSFINIKISARKQFV